LTRFKQYLKGDQYSFEKLKGVNHFLTPMDTPILAPALKKRLSDWLRNNGF
jgi:hypothetical protein